MAVRRGMGGPPQASDPTAVGRALTGPAAAWSASGTMRIPALGLKRKQWEPPPFASPALALFAFVIVCPLAYSFYLSFQNFDLSVGPEYEFVGAKNYTEALFRDQRFMGSVWNTALLIAPSLLLELLLGLGIALLLSRVLRGRPIITALLVIPSMVSPVMAPIAWRMMSGGKYGAISNLGRQLGLIFVLTFGGPGGATETVAFTTYLMGFKDFRMSYAAALSYVIVGGVLLLTLVFMWIQRVRETRVAA